MKETNVRNKNGSFKPRPLELLKKMDTIMEEVLKEYGEDLHPDEIQEIVCSSAHTSCAMHIALNSFND